MAESYVTFYEVIDPGPDVVVLDELGTGRHQNVLLIIVIWFWGSAGCGRIFAIIIPSNHREEA
jgi:hypothetical protein